MNLTRIFFTTLAASLLSLSAASAQEQTLRFKLVTTMTSDVEMKLPTVADQSVLSNEGVGVAYFEDGRVAFKRFVVTSVGGDEGSYFGLSTYTFENGDSISLRLDGGWTPQSEEAQYTVLSGTGAFEGATGTGGLTAVGDSWNDASLLDGSFTVQVGGN